MKNIQEITTEELEAIKVIIFDIDGVIIPVGTELHENQDGTELLMKTKQLSWDFLENIKKLKKYVRLGFSSGRNLLYLKSLTNEILDEQIILQAENGNITWLENKITHPVYSAEYFGQLRTLKEEVKKLMAVGAKIRGFEPKLFILTIHCDKMEEIPNLVQELAGGDLYCIWTNEGYDVGSQTMSKGVAIQNLAEQLGIEPKQIMTTGNNYNDAEMLKIGKGVLVLPERVEGEYFIKGDKLGGELLAEFLLQYYENR